MVEKSKANSKKKETKRIENQAKEKVKVKKKTVKKKQADEKSAHAKKAPNPKRILTWTCLICIFVGIVIFLCSSSLFKICKIEITGSNQVSQEIILQLSEINLESNIFLANTSKAKNNISANSYIKEVTIKRILPDKIKIDIVEKQKMYMLQLDEQYAYVDKNGFILEVAQTPIENLIILENYKTSKEEIYAGNFLNESDLEALEDIKNILKYAEKNKIHDKIASINIKDGTNYILKMPTYKKIIYVGDTSKLSTKMLRAKDIIDKTMEKEGKIFVNGDFNKGFDPYFREEANN